MLLHPVWLRCENSAYAVATSPTWTVSMTDHLIRQNRARWISHGITSKSIDFFMGA